jgi:antagonist of KipI
MDVTILRAGMMTTIQDLGRPGHLAQGVPVGGAVDSFALRVANLLVGNPEGAPALEMTLIGPELEFGGPTWIAVGGAAFDGVPVWRPIRVEAGSRLRFGNRLRGCRAYLAVAGGFDVAPVMGGRGTFLAAGLGGFHGRPLRDGDVVPTCEAERSLAGHWSLDERVLPAYSREPLVRVIAGTHAGAFGPGLFAGRFAVTARSNRMGIRLDGPKLGRSTEDELVSTAVAPGTIQVPPDGNPIVLMADAQTLGGYPRIGHVASADLPLLAQLAPGDGVRFAAATLAEAHGALQASERALALLRQGLAAKVRPA